MDLDSYQARAIDTQCGYPGIDSLEYPVFLTLALNEEAGEAAGVIKKVIRKYGSLAVGFHEESEMRKKLVEELGDVLWYLAVLAEEIGYSLNFVAEVNLNKLQARMANGTIAATTRCTEDY